MNRIEDADIPSRLGEVILAALRIQPKSVWLCSSETEAQRFQNTVSEWLNLNGLVGHPTWLLTPLGSEIDQFKESPSGHLFVAGRFDGMDFQEEQCRLVVLTTLPRAINSQEEFISSYLRDSGFMLRRLNQRVVQALGRCNRSEEDFGVYVLADRRIATHFGRESNKAGLPRNIIAEIDMAQDMAEIEVDALVGKVENFLQGDFREYDRDIQAYVEDVPVEIVEAELPDTSAHEINGWASLFASHNYEIAADRFERCWDIAREANLLEMGALYGWQLAKALYLQSLQGERGMRERSLDIFERAIRRGGQSSWFNRMRSSLYRARQTPVTEEVIRDEYANHVLRVFDELFEKQGGDGNKFARWCSGITEALQSERHAQYQEGLEKLGQVLGYYATRPQYNAATDCRWRGVFGNSREVITFEAKIEHHDGQEVSAYHVGQAHNQLTRALTEFDDNGYAVRGTIVTHLTSITPDAEAASGTIKIITKPAVLALWNRVRVILSLYRDGWALYDIPARRAAAQAIRARLPSTGWLIRVLSLDVRFIVEEHMLAEWPPA
jgi:tetratricopeptide (TPR) repeat protein